MQRDSFGDRFERQTAVHEGEDNGNGGSGRNDYLFRLACSLRAKDVGKSEAMGEVQSANEADCVPPLSTKEVAKCVESAYVHHAGHSAEFDASKGSTPKAAVSERASAESDKDASWTLSGVPEVALPDPPDLAPEEMLIEQAEAMYAPGALFNVVTEHLPNGDPVGAGRMLRRDTVREEGLAESVLGAVDSESGAWVRVNATDGRPSDHGKKAESDEGVTDYRCVLLEVDPKGWESMTAEELEEQKRTQFERMLRLRFPLACVVDSGHKSIHGVVRVDAKDRAEWEERRDLVYKVADANGLPHDPNCANPSRLTRLAGAMRGDSVQALLALNVGASSFGEWEEFVTRNRVPDPGRKPRIPGPARLSEWIEDPPEQRPVLIGWPEPTKSGRTVGLVREGALFYLNGASKSGKSWLAEDLAISVASGTQWLGYPCKRGRVLLCDFELQTGDLWDRIRKILGYRKRLRGQEDIEERCAANLFPWSLRDYVNTLDRLAPDIIHYVRELAEQDNELAYGYFELIVFDPLYLIEIGDENSASDMAKLFRVVRRIQLSLGCACLLVHHHKKGQAGSLVALDRGAGSGAIGRNGDAILDLSPLFLDEWHQATLNSNHPRAFGDSDVRAFRLDPTVRAFDPQRPIDVIWTKPVFTVADSGDRLYECPVVGEDRYAEKQAQRQDKATKRREAIVSAVSRALEICESEGVRPTKKEVLDRAEWGDECGEVTESRFGKFFEGRNADWFPFETVREEGNVWTIRRRE